MERVYTQSHEWLMLAATRVTIGITNYGQQSLGEIVFVELPSVGQTISQGQTLCVVESVKAASEILSPVSGIVTQANDALLEAPYIINRSPEQQGWLCVLKVAADTALDADQFLSGERYRALVSS